ncbi:MAG: protein kinase, partial [Acidobacteria bacterium]|nr:protein kinase [Acidobacteriota bacterium]
MEVRLRPSDLWRNEADPKPPDTLSGMTMTNDDLGPEVTSRTTTEVQLWRPTTGQHEAPLGGPAFDDLLALGLEIPASQRAAWLADNCEDPDLRREVLELLDREADLGDFLEPPAMSIPRHEAQGSLRQNPGSAARAGDLPETVGPYRILELLGEGGMGVVYLAEQDEPVERQLAVKVVRADLTARGARERFVAERRALARLSHPYIAQMYEAGTTDQGFPYFAMERIGGEPITAYCDSRQLSIEERLSLFVKVCEGVQHAHLRGIIHRDLK